MTQSPPSLVEPSAGGSHEQSLRERLEALRRESESSPGEIVFVGVEAPAGRADLLVERFAGRPCLLWSPPEGPSFAGIGEAASISATGPGRFREIRERGEALLRRVGSSRMPLEDLSAPRLFGGFAFDPRGASSEPWQGFGAARFALPRVLYAVRGERAVLGLFARRDELGSGSSHVELLLSAYRAVSAPLAALPASAPSPRAGWETDADDFRCRVEALVRQIGAGKLHKAVAARQVALDFGVVVSAAATVVALHEQAPECTRFLFQCGPGSFVGASPERLLRKRGQRLETEALAGTADAGSPMPERRLEESLKDLGEHRWVVQAIRQALEPACSEVHVPEQPCVRRLKHLLHLGTPITATLAAPTHLLSVLSRLHPTPAVGGSPTAPALSWIRDNESFDRGWYSGAVGWFDAAGDGDFNVALRSGLIRDRRAWLYAGAGIVVDSKPADEYRETALKLSALMASLRSRP